MEIKKRSARALERDVKRALSHTDSGLFLRHNAPVLKMFGCRKCSWAGKTLCPHKKMDGEMHANGICSDRVLYIKEEMKKIGSLPRLVQNEEALKLKMLADRMVWEWGETGELDPEYKHLSKNLISLIDKMRKQDEGIKFQGELTVVHEDFRNMVDMEVKKLEERNNKPGQKQSVIEVQKSQ